MAKKNDANRPTLSRARRARGWTQNHVATALHALAATDDAFPELRLDGNTISRWERGDQIPQPHHVILLCRLFGMTAAELGLADTPSSAGPSATVIPHPGVHSTPTGLHATLDDEQSMDRRQFSKAVTASLIGGLAI